MNKWLKGFLKKFQDIKSGIDEVIENISYVRESEKKTKGMRQEWARKEAARRYPQLAALGEEGRQDTAVIGKTQALPREFYRQLRARDKGRRQTWTGKPARSFREIREETDRIRKMFK